MESGKGKSSRYARDDENLINRAEEGIRAYFGRRVPVPVFEYLVTPTNIF